MENKNPNKLELYKPDKMMSTYSDGFIARTMKMLTTVVEYKELLMMYACAMKEVQTKFEVLNTEFNVRYRRNPISSIETRLKSSASIAQKLAKQDAPLSIESLESSINDIAGVRVICSYIDDIYTIADAFLSQDDVVEIARKDYIAEPKENGYRSLHLIVTIPVFFADHRQDMKVEVQIRTIAMDFWANLEHELKYKKVSSTETRIVEELKACADVINATDEKMLELRRQIEAEESIPSEREILMERLSKLDVSIKF